MSTSSMASTSSGVSVRPSDLHVAVRRRRLHTVIELLASDAAWTLWAVGGTRMDPLQLAEAMEEHLNASGRHDEANRSREIAHHLRRHKETKDNAKLLTWLRRLRSKYSEMRAALRKSEDDASSPTAALEKCSKLRQAISDTKSTLSVAREILAPRKKKASESSSAALDSCNCVVCWNIPSDVVLCCPTCETLLCKSCADRLSRSTCPCCRVGFEEVPPKRTRAVERILQSMRTTNQIPDDSDDDDDEEEDYFGATVDCSGEHDQAHLILRSSRSSPVSLTSTSSGRVAITPRRRDNTRRLVFDILDDDLEDMVDARLFCCCS